VANDALDPGPDGDYPWFPRLADGSWDVERMPVGNHKHWDGEKWVIVNLTPRHPDGSPIVPPGMTLPPGA
jgi:hypothetical protein